MSEPCCGQCRHWYRIGPAPAPAGPVLLSAQDTPVAGQCRLQLVTLMRPDGMCQSMYGQVVASFPCCSHYDVRPDIRRMVQEATDRIRRDAEGEAS